MNQKLKFNQYVLIASMLFGLFFGAGNLIFPIILGAKAGNMLIPALGGMLVTAVGIPLLGIVSMGISRSEGLLHMSGRVSKGYSYFFTCALYLTIGPLFAIPRCAATSFTMGIQPMVGEYKTIAQLIFTALFFAAVLFFALRPSNILNSVGKWLNPTFLIFLGILVVAALINPVQSVASVQPTGDYATGAFANGFFQGYDTLDALASLAFGIIVINVIRDYDIKEPSSIAKSTIKSGIFSMLIMAFIYTIIAVVGAQSYGLFSDKIGNADFTGGDIFSIVAEHYFGKWCLILLAITVTFCCLKTAVGLVTSCAETFSKMFGGKVPYAVYAIVFTAFSFLVSNIGLSKIITLSAPVLYFLYPLSIVLILLSLFGKLFSHNRAIYACSIGFTTVTAFFDLLRVSGVEKFNTVIDWVATWLPFYKIGLGWVVPALIGFVIGFIIKCCTGERFNNAE